MVNVGRAVRQFERTFLSHTNPNEPPDDRKTMNDMMRYSKPPQLQPNPEELDELIAIVVENITYDAQGRVVDRQTRIERPEKYSK